MFRWESSAPIHAALEDFQARRIPSILVIIDQSGNVNETPWNGLTPLYLASVQLNVRIVHRDQITPIHRAVKFIDVDFVKY